MLGVLLYAIGTQVRPYYERQPGMAVEMMPLLVYLHQTHPAQKLRIPAIFHLWRGEHSLSNRVSNTHEDEAMEHTRKTYPSIYEIVKLIKR